MLSVWYQIKAIPCHTMTSWYNWGEVYVPSRSFCETHHIFDMLLDIALFFTKFDAGNSDILPPFATIISLDLSGKQVSLFLKKAAQYLSQTICDFSQFYTLKLTLLLLILLRFISSLHDFPFCSSAWTRKCLILNMRFKKSQYIGEWF